MARHARKHPAPARRGTRLAAALAVCCALSLAFIPTAIAKHDHSELAGGRPAPAEASAPGTSSPAASGQTGAATATAPTEAAPANGQPASAGQDSASTSASATAKPGAGTQARHGKEGTKSKRSHETALKGNGKGKSASGSGAAGEGEAAGTSTPTTSSPGTTTATAAPAAGAATATAAATTTQATTPPATAIATPPAVVRSTRASRRSARGRRRGVTARRAGPDALASAGAVSAAAAPASSASAARARHARARTHAAKPHGRPSPLVTTITKIVGVVPVAVRVLIAALLALALALAVRTRVAALRARRLERQRGQLLEDVGLLQAALLPTVPARLGPVGTSVAYQPAAGPGAGGDFYDVFALADGQLAVIVGDVSGHGRQALPHTALVRFTLRAYLEAGLSPRDAVQTAGAVLARQLGGVFATVVVATYQPRERVLVYACAGHPPPVVLGAGTRARSHATGGATVAATAAAQAVAPVTVSASPPIGVGMRTGTRQTVVSIPGRSQICFYTDGLTEARVGSELFGTERLLSTLAELGHAATASAVLARIAERADARPDDMAACLLNVDGDDEAPAVLVEELELDRDEAENGRTERFLLACGVERHEVAELMRAASVAAARTGTVVLEARHGEGGPPQVTLRREQITYLHARRADVAVAQQPKVAL